MKAQRRHELQQSDLAKVIKQAPGFWQQSGGRWLLAAIVVLVIVVLIRYRMSSNAQAAASAKDDLAVARNIIEQLRSPQMVQMTLMAPPSDVAMRRRQAFSEASNAIQDATAKSDDRVIAAEALIARGDLCWTTAMLPEIPGAVTQPTLNLRDPKELISNATEAYQNVLNSYADVKNSAIAAHFGLAAIAENQQNWDAARQHYAAITSATADLDPFHLLAKQRSDLLAKLQQPVILAKPATEPAMPTFSPSSMPTIPPLIAAPKPATTQATAMPTTKISALAPIAPATKPATTKP